MGELAALTTALFWSWTAFFFTVASRRVGSLTVNIFRMPLGALLLVLTYALPGGVFSATRNQVFLLALSGVIGLAIGDGFLFESFVLIGPRLTLLLFTTSPLMTAVLAYIVLGETINMIGLLGMAVTIGGVAWVITEKKEGGHGFHRRGGAYALCAALGQAVGLLFAKEALNSGIDALLATIIRMSAGTLAIAVVIPILGKPDWKGLFREKRGALPFFLGGVVFGPYLGVWLSQVAVKRTQTGIAATLFSTLPVLILPISRYVEHEKISSRAVIGAVLALIGVALLFFR
jgi:drug/metabolite transporter (DMT)-like permease